jgi:hypothetical protein
LRQFMAERWGDMELVALTPGPRRVLQGSEGVLVVRAPADTTLGLQDGDVIVDIAGASRLTPGTWPGSCVPTRPGERLVMTVIRQGERRSSRPTSRDKRHC